MALELVPLYSDVNWIHEESEEAKRTVAQFQEWGKANTYLYRLLAGQLEVLAEYVNYISSQQGEIFTALFYIVKSANLYNWNVDSILERFSDYMPYRIHLNEFGMYNQQIKADQHARFLVELGVYYLRNKRSEGIGYILKGLESSSKLKNESMIFKCVDLFEQNRHIAGEDEQRQYKILIREVRDANEKKTPIIASLM